VTVINPADFPLIGLHGHVTADLLRRMGTNADRAEGDWKALHGSEVRRRWDVLLLSVWLLSGSGVVDPGAG